MEEEKIPRFKNKKVVIYLKVNEVIERYYCILVEVAGGTITYLDSKNRLMIFSISSIENIMELSPRQRETFDRIRHEGEAK